GIHLNDGAGDFSNSSDVHVLTSFYDPGPLGIACGDVTGDGLPDLVACLGAGYNALGQSNRKIEVLAGDGAGGFTAWTTIHALDRFPIDCAIADFDNDGQQDIVAVCNHGGISVFLGDGAGAFSAPIGESSPWGCVELAVGDLDADGNLDVVTTKPQQAQVHWGDGTGGFAAITTLPGGSTVDVVDANGDGNLDVVAAGGAYGTLSLAVMLGDGGRAFAQVASPGVAVRVGAVGDANGDGIPDLLGRGSGATVFWSRGVGDGTFVAGPSLPHAGAVFAGDWNGDGQDDAAMLTIVGGTDVFLTTGISTSVPGPWHFLGGGAAGQNLPLLRGSGSLALGAPFTLTLSHAAANAPVLLIAGLTEAPQPFYGGTLWPSPDILLTGLGTNSTGTLDLPAAWPLPAGWSLVLQGWVADAAAPAAWAGSNGLRAGQ
ncbi:MAG TPA: VCBS repeat-containing protein, partial [bacterium]|nr:VCBS repeat-containing protein [bacterium]